MNPVLRVEALEKAFGGLRVTRDVSLTVEDGELHAVIGPNGAGKTTLLTELFGELAVDSGTVTLCGKDVTRLPSHKRVRLGVSRSFQITTLVRELTVLDNAILAAMALEGHAFKFWRPVRQELSLIEVAQSILARVGIAPSAEQTVANLSYGEQRLLELAIALAGRPKLILLDEPMAGLGRDESRRMTELLQSWKGRTTILLVEHDMDAVFKLADRITVLVRGQVLATGTPSQIRELPEVREAYLGEDD